MFIRQRQVRDSVFESKFAKASTRKREHAASIYATAFVQGILAMFLIVGVFRSYDLMSSKFPDLPWFVRIGVPLGILLVALIILRAFIDSVRHGIAVQRVSRRSSADEPD